MPRTTLEMECHRIKYIKQLLTVLVDEKLTIENDTEEQTEETCAQVDTLEWVIDLIENKHQTITNIKIGNN